MRASPQSSGYPPAKPALFFPRSGTKMPAYGLPFRVVGASATVRRPAASSSGKRAGSSPAQSTLEPDGLIRPATGPKRRGPRFPYAGGCARGFGCFRSSSAALRAGAGAARDETPSDEALNDEAPSDEAVGVDPPGGDPRRVHPGTSGSSQSFPGCRNCSCGSCRESHAD